MAKRRLTLQERLARYREPGTVLRVGSAGATPTTSRRLSESGVQTIDAQTTLVDGQDSGKAPTTHGLDRIRDGAGSVRALLDWAALTPPGVERPAVEFVNEAFARTARKRPTKAQIDNYALIEGRLGFYEVQARAREWDTMGFSTPKEFVDALACEVSGNEKGDSVAAVLRDTGWEAVRFSDIDERDGDDEYGKWRYGE